MALSRPRALVLRALGLGDLLTAVPALKALRRALPDHEVVLATPAPLHPLLRPSLEAQSAGELVDRCVDARGLEPIAWEGPPPDIAVNLHGRGPQSHRLLQALAPGRLIAFATQDAGHEGLRWAADEHEVARWCRLVEESFDVGAPVTDLRLPLPSATPPVAGAVVVHPGAAFPSRRWPAERFAAVARWAEETGHRVVVTGGPEEVALAQRVARLAGLPPDRVLAGRTDLTLLSALIAAARLLICGDTGVAHLATAFGTPSVVLFGPVSPVLWGPPATGPHTVLWHGDGKGDPWGDDVDPGLLRIGVDEVTGAAEVLLRAPIRTR